MSNLLTYKSFTPRQLPGVWGWWDGSDPLGNGSKPTGAQATWVDKSAYKNNFTQATGANQPTVLTNAKNGRNGLLFSTTKTMLTANPPLGATFTTNPRSLILVFSITTTIAGANHVIWNQGNGGNGTNTTFGHFNAGGATLGIDSGGSGQYITYNTTTLVQNTFYIWEYYSPSGTLTASNAIINDIANSVTSHAYTGGVVASSAMTIGGSGGVTMLEIIASSSQLSTVQASMLRTYLKIKWGIGANTFGLVNGNTFGLINGNTLGLVYF